MSTRTSFADGLVSLDMRETRARLAEAMAATKVHPSWAEGSKGKLLQDAVSRVERELLTSARGAIQILDEALQEADFKPVPATAAEAHAQIVSELDADRPPAPVRQSPPPSPLGARRVQVPPPRPRLPQRP
ncbi:hypothetical protein ASF58_11030 [Methylobacterium sp. Leaf125]|uniref:hypothetical protein n=1 Tax=Methylobacterium sp. Leaf125 TaxID=1736265 RepID=UPI0006F1F7A1|nr:hypothetical protein [Methylobacterium sp. Leaf125]KQQ32065.1 hypothetical protein ASF58_11030 [Methylobacterium sp. Leaf125]